MVALLRRFRWALLMVALVAAGLTFAFWPAAIPVDAGKVTRGPMRVGITEDGVTRVEEYFVISAPVTGYMGRIELEPGDPVRRGDLLTRMTGRPSTPLDPRTRQQLQAELQAARAGQSSAAASLAQARRDLARAEELAKRGFLPRAQLENARSRVSVAAATLAEANAGVARVAAALAQNSASPSQSGLLVPVRIPVDGTIMSVLSESEGVIPEGTPLATVGDARKIEAVVDFLSRDAVQVKPGNRVEITQWGGEKPISGFVRRVEPFGRLKVSALGVEEQRVNVVIGFSPQAADQVARLGHGYQIDGAVILWEAPEVIRVPIGALFRGGDGNWRVFVVNHGKAQERAVRIGHINDEYGEVISAGPDGGLAEGDQVILNPGNALKDGSRVTIR